MKNLLQLSDIMNRAWGDHKAFTPLPSGWTIHEIGIQACPILHQTDARGNHSHRKVTAYKLLFA